MSRPQQVRYKNTFLSLTENEKNVLQILAKNYRNQRITQTTIARDIGHHREWTRLIIESLRRKLKIKGFMTLVKYDNGNISLEYDEGDIDLE